MVPEYFKFPGYLAPSSNLKIRRRFPMVSPRSPKCPLRGWAAVGCPVWLLRILRETLQLDPADPRQTMARAAGQTIGKLICIITWAVSDGNQWDSPFQDACLSKQFGPFQFFFWPCEHLHPGKLGRLRHMIGVWGGFVMFFMAMYGASPTTPLFPALLPDFPDFFSTVHQNHLRKKHAARHMGLRASSAMATWCLGHHSRAHCRILRAEKRALNSELANGAPWR